MSANDDSGVPWDTFVWSGVVVCLPEVEPSAGKTEGNLATLDGMVSPYVSYGNSVVVGVFDTIKSVVVWSVTWW